MERRTLNNKAHQKEFTRNPSIRRSVREIINALRTSAKTPNVTNVMGSVRKNRIGLIEALIMPNTNATIKAVTNESTYTPGNKYAATKTAIPLINQLINIFMMIHVIHLHLKHLFPHFLVQKHELVRSHSFVSLDLL